MHDAASDEHRQTAPRNASDRWWVAAITGIVAIILWFAMGASPASAGDISRFGIALLFLAFSVGQIVEGARFRNRSASFWATLQGGVGAMASLPTLLATWVDAIQPVGAWQTLALGLIIYGIIGLAWLGFTVRVKGFPRVAIAVLLFDLVPLALGVLFLIVIKPEDIGDAERWGSSAFAVGLGALAIAYARWRKTRSAA